jgi:hypothetical protein
MSCTFLLVNLMLLSVSLGLLVHCWTEKKMIRDFAISAIGTCNEPLEVVLALGGTIYRFRKSFQKSKSSGIDHDLIPFPFFSALGATPGSILGKGGCCAGMTRLTIVSLDALGFKSGSITVSTPSGAYHHCLVEVSMSGHNLIIDPTYGLYYIDRLGQPIGLSDLQLGAAPSFASLPRSKRTSYPPGRYYKFDYRKTKTANWSRSCCLNSIHSVLNFVTNGAIDRFKQPVVLEWPQIVLATSITVLLLFMNLAMLVFG